MIWSLRLLPVLYCLLKNYQDADTVGIDVCMSSTNGQKLNSAATEHKATHRFYDNLAAIVRAPKSCFGEHIARLKVQYNSDMFSVSHSIRVQKHLLYSE
jgi:hypothetical protein